MGSETQGLTFSASDQSMSILDTGTPANNYSGDLSAKLGSIRTSAAMCYLSSGLYRVTIVGAIPATTGYYPQLNSASADSSDTRVNNATYYAGYWQLEAGPFATSYIPTTTATVTRAADITSLAIAPAATSTITLVSAFNLLSTASANNTVLQIDDGTANNRCLNYAETTNPRNFCAVGGAVQLNDDLGTLVAALSKNTIASGFAANDFGGSHNGNAAITDSVGSMPTGITTIRFGKDTSGNYLNGWFRHGRYFPRRVDNATLVTMAAAA